MEWFLNIYTDTTSVTGGFACKSSTCVMGKVIRVPKVQRMSWRVARVDILLQRARDNFIAQYTIC